MGFLHADVVVVGYPVLSRPALCYVSSRDGTGLGELLEKLGSGTCLQREIVASALFSPGARALWTHVDAVHEVEELLDAVLALPSLPTLDLLAAVLEVLGWTLTFLSLALFSDSRCRLY